MIASARPALLGDSLIRAGIVSDDQLRIALTEQMKSGEPLGRLLVRLGFVTEANLRETLSQTLGQESLELHSIVPDPQALQLIPKSLAQRTKALPVSYDAERSRLTVAMPDTFDLIALDQLRAQLGAGVELASVLSGEAEIIAAIDRLYSYEFSVDGILHEIETGDIDYESLQSDSQEYSHPLVRLVNAILNDAVRRGASDIHFEPEEGFLRVRYRIDGVLRQVRSFHSKYWSAIAVRLKVIAAMNIAETRAPQDGRFSLSTAGQEVDFRASVLRTTHGENIVLRVLDRQKGIVSIDRLGLNESALAQLNFMMARPEGIVLVTGPTGSGKTTTLYSMLSYLNDERVNIMTLEDPVEYPMPMIRQTSVNEAIKLNFANGIRTLMRQDPDIILVGEIRDEDTAEMAFRAAMTGHQVYSTLHCNSAVGAIPRLVDIGVSREVLSGNIIGIVAQRLVRKLCDHCKEGFEPSELERAVIGGAVEKVTLLYRPRACERCEHQGYRGRIALMEVLRVDRQLDQLIAQSATTGEIMTAAASKGFHTLADDGLRRVLEGVTSLDEVSRVVDLTDRV
jgi:type II secretory ATPase GspE/PulE/Tfp pilus assembly ATPase PilB-like protein